MIKVYCVKGTDVTTKTFNNHGSAAITIQWHGDTDTEYYYQNAGIWAKLNVSKGVWGLLLDKDVPNILRMKLLVGAL